VDLILLILIVVGLSFLCELIDSMLGGGFGSILTPIFLLAGFELVMIVPMILISEIFTGLIAGGFHNSFGHVDKTVLKWLVPMAALGSITAVLLSIKVSKIVLSLYVGILILAMGILMLIKYVRSRNGNSMESEKKHNWRLPIIGAVIGFNKSVSAGGFGPLATAGISWAGYDAKKSVGTTTLAEGIVCTVGLATYFITKGVPPINWTIAIPLWVGAICATYPAAWAVKKLNVKALGLAVGLVVTGLGIAMLMNLPG
jgi:uncharacterized protein